MTCSNGYPLRALVAAVVLAAAGPSAAESPDAEIEAKAAAADSTTEPLDLKTLLGAFAKMPGLEARFVEEKHMKLLAAPLESRGTLYFAQPGLLARHVEHPRESKVVITPETLRYDDGEEEGKIDLRGRPDVKLFVESFVRVLAGDREGLATIYDVRFEPEPEDGEGWLLEMIPKGEPLSHLVDSLRIRGEGLAVREIRMEEASGDLTVTRILEADPKRRFSDEERKRLFGKTGR